MEMDIKAIEKATSLIKEFEGLRLDAYYCSANVRTIGFGHAITASDNIQDSITLEKAEELLRQDILIADSCLYRNTLGVDLNSNQRAALISFIFNLGGGTFQRSTLRQKLLRGEYGLAAQEFERFIYAGGKKLNGLIRRRIAERELFETPVEIPITLPSKIGIWTSVKNYFCGNSKYGKVKI